jgi:hypothetical protein
MSNTTGPNSSTKAAQTLVEALESTGLFAAKPVEHGCAVKVETKAKRANAAVPVAVATVWLPDPGIGAGYVWTAPTDHELPAYIGVDQVVEALKATLLPEVEL